VSIAPSEARAPTLYSQFVRDRHIGVHVGEIDAIAQEKLLKEQLVGTWTLLLTSTKLPDGTDVWGSDPIGLLIVTNNGFFSSQTMRSDRPKFASNSRVKGTPEENKAVVHGSVSSFGMYTVDETEKTITFRYLGSTFPNRERTQETWPLVINGDKLQLTHPVTSVRGPPSVLTYERAKNSTSGFAPGPEEVKR
jgi:Lipocalin-like domain